MNYILITLLATLFTYGITAIGASTVLFLKTINTKFLEFTYGLSSGIMIAASFFSLLLPAIDEAIALNQIDWLVISIGFLLGGLFIYFLDKIFANKLDNSLGLMIFAITLHNIPEGMAIGVAIGSCFLNNIPYSSALILALGIGIQNFPEGAAISLPLYSNGTSKFKSFFIAQATGFVEIIAGLLGAIFVTFVRTILPFILSFAAGAMIYVVSVELIPSMHKNEKSQIGTIGVLIGFTLMMILDLAL